MHEPAPPEPQHDAARALYRWRAAGYELQLAPYEFIRRMAVQQLALRRGDCVLDLGCGTGLSLPLLCDAVGPSGQVVAVDLSPQMLAIAAQRVRRERWTQVQLQCCAAEDAAWPAQADAALLHLTHDILQSPAALDHLLRHLRAGARVVATGLKWTAAGLLPWNMLVGWHLAQSVTNYQGLLQPWQLLAERGVALQVDLLLMGTVFIAHGAVTGPAARPARQGSPA